MKLKALQDFNLGSMSKDYQEGDVLEEINAHGKELIAAGLAEEVAADAEVTPKPKPGAKRVIKTTGPLETK